MTRISFVALTLIGVAALSPRADAAFVFTLTQSGADVVGSGSGTLDVFDLSIVGDSSCSSGVVANEANEVSCSGGSSDHLIGITGPTNFGSGGAFLATGETGDDVGVIGSSPTLEIPDFYKSGAALSDTLTFAGETFSSLGLTPGSYTWTWGTGPDVDSYTVDIVTAAVTTPEPGSLGLFGLALAFLTLPRWRGRTARGVLVA